MKTPNYHGAQWIRSGLPKKMEPWSLSKDDPTALKSSLREATAFSHWTWPKRTIYFLTDPHADAEAFVASMVASGGVVKIGSKLKAFKLTEEGEKALFIIGGDCLDKGPSNLKLLRTIRYLIDLGAKVKLLAGNHDMRLLMGIRILGEESDTLTEHMFIRMGPKVVPLLKEVHQEYLLGTDYLANIPSQSQCKQRLYPSKDWFERFPKRAGCSMRACAVKRETKGMAKKVAVFEQACSKAGLSLRDVYASALKCRDLFFDTKGDFYWFFNEMKLAYRAGSFLFVHAGLDDHMSCMMQNDGIRHINQLFQYQINHDLFNFYYGPVANILRTKYRDVDFPLSHDGVKRTYRKGIHAVVHGHRNRTKGQQLMLRQGMLHIESDITMDRNSRKKEGLDGYGAGVTVIRPEGQVLGISTDHPYVKLFEPEKLLESH